MTTVKEERVDFTPTVRLNVARKAMYICSNPNCLRLTGFQTKKGKPRAIAQVAHILPAARQGPRQDAVVDLPDGSKLKQGDEGNAIWLCLPCHFLIDADEDNYPGQMLVDWKREHEERVTNLVGLDLEQSLLQLGSVRKSHDLARDLLVWLDGQRFMYFEDSREFPSDVRLALDALRSKLSQQLGSVGDVESRFAVTLRGVQAAVLQFFETLNEVRIDEITVTSKDSEFGLFSRSLQRLRQEIKREIHPLAREQNFTFTRIQMGDE